MKPKEIMLKLHRLDDLEKTVAVLDDLCKRFYNEELGDPHIILKYKEKPKPENYSDGYEEDEAMTFKYFNIVEAKSYGNQAPVQREVSFGISETETLEVFGTLLRNVMVERDELVKELNEAGIKVK